MGVPAFFRWLSRKYASIVIEVNEKKPQEINGVKIPVDTSEPNPNDIEFDNLYLDMNGIIHPCSHPEDRPAPKNEVEIMIAIFEAIDRLFNIVRPRRILYMAIDGVAPRAKMNQQRSRRFRASKEGAELSDLKSQIKSELRGKGMLLPDETKVEKFDSNCITPGTEFMHRLANCLRFYIIDRLNSDPGWKNIEVILSDANVPGEGEHKIMDFIRRQRAQPHHDPNTHHCICGADADLIMLGLATHEPNFTIIREEFKPNAPRPCGICAQYGHEMEDCQGLPRTKEGELGEVQSAPPGTGTNYIFIRICVIREYIRLEMDMPNLPFEYDFENIIDDWVMMCFFVGNDFLPHLPSLEIREGAIDKLIRIYKDIVHQTGGYLTSDGICNLGRVEKIMRGIGKMEDEIFRKRREGDLRYRARNREQNKQKRQKTAADRGPAYIPGGQLAPTALGKGLKPAALTNVRETAADMRTTNLKNASAADEIKKMLKMARDASAGSSEPAPEPTPTVQEKLKRKKEEEEDAEPDDEVRLWEDGWKERYFRAKFNVSMKDYEFRRKVVRSYVEGLCWVLSYYYQGCVSWKWFFPFHYAPFASDFVDIEQVDTRFPTDTVPKNPMEQLMCVFPAASGNFLPTSWRRLMSDPDSPIIDFYPEDFKIDLNGKKYAWQGVALLPFVDEGRMIRTLKSVYPDLTEQERIRNSLGNDFLFVGKHHPLHALFKGLYEDGKPPASYEEAADIDPALTKGMAGKIWNDPKCDCSRRVKAPLPGLSDVEDNEVLSMSFKDPQYPVGHIFKAKLLPGAKFPPSTVKPEDFHSHNNRRGRGRGGGRGGYHSNNGRDSWQPRIGFNPNRQRMRLDDSGHRHLNHHLPHGGQQHQQYGRQQQLQRMFNPQASQGYHQQHQQQQRHPHPYGNNGGQGGRGFPPPPSYHNYRGGRGGHNSRGGNRGGGGGGFSRYGTY